ncbi:neprilysin-1-like isoform X2 [Ornithodoros turicata]|uniref:neprilysin-1-like isoform X2 n=1 Tax=Ornithodoros turicata TaxID=34597 RepID=UPI003139F4C7
MSEAAEPQGALPEDGGRTPFQRPMSTIEAQMVRARARHAMKEVQEVCNTEDCHYMRWLIKLSVDTKKDPCENFYAFVCSGAEPHLSQLYTQAGGGNLDLITYNISLAIFRSLNDEPVPPTGQTGFQKSAAFFQKCMHSPSDKDAAAIRDFLVQHDMDIAMTMVFDPLSLMVEFMVTIDIPLVFCMTASAPHGSEKFTIQIAQHSAFIRSRSLNAKSEQQRKNEVANVLSTIFSTNIDTSLVDNIAKAEIDVIRVSRSNDQSTRTLKTFEISQLGNIGGDNALSVRWSTVLSTHTGSRLPQGRQAIMSRENIEFFHHLFGKRRKLTEAELRLYFLLRTAMYAYGVSGFGVDRALQQDRCKVSVQENFPIAASSSVLFRTTNNSSRIRAVNRMADEVIAEIKKSFGHSSWLDAPTRRRVQEKISSLNKVIGYLTQFDTPGRIDTFYRNLPGLHGPYITDFFSVNEFRTKIMWDNILRDNLQLSEHRHVPVHIVNAFYSVADNAMIVPPAVMLRPAFALGGPPEVNYGALGRILTHEIMHGFDEVGRHFDGKGVNNSLYAEASLQKYEALLRCHNKSVEGATKTRRSASYKNEYLADTMGAMSLHKAYKKAKRGSEVHLGDVTGLTRDQVFYVSWCLLWCGKYLEDGERMDERCNIPFMNSAHFSEAFSCSKDSPMNPSRKCRFW